MARRQRKPNTKSPPGRLRIVAGNWRSRLLQIADVPGLRPTSERVRETVFNWLAPRIQGARCLDLFAGTGALGLEALSRGAASVVFVESSKRAAAMLRRNIEELDARQARLVQRDVVDYLTRPRPARFDIVFVDPPFAGGMIGDTCRRLAESGLLADDAVVYLEEDRSRSWPELPDGWSLDKARTAGNVRYALVTTKSA